ncbi:hypothetical protein [[Curtobacterium] plantarum]|uniref:C2H2-type domain-containing protein n=1 Tax=[Curtobacterium] plantarum TaxID=221276 RepID=A0ABT9T6G7_9GAMM|nr:hypothetical protein [[Curtobacterium] plantarum]MDQ0019059.1 hypothetical protein [[Curtobacterium] plantarum]
MSDELDQAAALEELERTIALANRPKPSMQFTGAYYNCEESVDKGFFCCPECRTDYERIERAKQHRRVA